MNSNVSRLLGIAAMGMCATVSFAQDWGFECVDPENTAPRTNHAAIRRLNSIMHAATGISGQTTYGGNQDIPGPCFLPSFSLEIAGGFGFAVGSEGSVQDQNPPDPTDNFVDEFLVHNFGMPTDPNRDGGICETLEDGDATIFGANGFSGFWAGLSGRYYQIETTHGNFFVQLRVDVIGDAARLQWTFTNNDTAAAHPIGMRFGLTAGMLAQVPDRNGATQAFTSLGTLTPNPSKPGFVEMSAGRPPITPQRFDRITNAADFPQYVNLLFGQSAAYGLRMDMGPTPQTSDPNGNSDCTIVDRITIGRHFILGGPFVFSQGGVADQVVPDTSILGWTQVLQTYNELEVPAGSGTPGPENPGTRRIVQYVRTPWGNGNYNGPYTAVVDAPQLVASDPNGQNGLSPNPMTLRVYVDNAQDFNVANQNVPLQEVRVKLIFPGPGITMAAGEQQVKTINSIPAGQMSFVEWDIESDGIVFGDIPYRVEIEATPGGSKVITGAVRVSSTPRIEIKADANLIGIPWQVADSSWEAVLGLQAGVDFRAYKWDPQQNSYVVSTGIERGRGQWIVAATDFGVIDLQGNPTAPPDIPTGAPNIQLKAGWNLISNPYPYAVQLGQIIGVPAGSGVRTWAQLVQAGFVNSALAFYDNNSGDYNFVQGVDAVLFPHRGYWVYLNTQNDLTLSYPPVYARFLPGSTRSGNGSTWTQTANQWRLKLAARTAKSQDSQNYVGLVRTAADIRTNELREIPMSPVGNVALSIEETANGQPVRMAQAYTDKLTRRTWRVFVNTTEESTVTVTWPNLSTIPKNVRFKITDVATNTTRDLRQTSGYTFSVPGAANREFLLEMIPGTQVKAIIGNVLVTRSRAPLAPFSIRYTLSSDAVTTVRVLSSSGKEVYSVHRGRADGLGENEVQWAMRDNANRLVAPGSYRIEILAETSEGDRSRKIVPVNVIR